MSMVIFHPSVAPFVQQAARALHEAAALERFVVAVYDQPAAWSQRAICKVTQLGGLDLARQFRRRAITEVPLEKMESHPLGELLRLATAAVDRDGRATDFVWELTETGFDRRVARSLGPGLHGVYGYEHSSLATFQRAKALGLQVVYDMPAPATSFVEELLNRELEKFPELRTPLKRYTAKRDARRIARRRAEWECADLVIAASRFTAQSFARTGLDTTKVRIVPYGAPPPAPRQEALRKSGDSQGPVTFLWAGTFSLRKGAHYLLEAWRQGGFGRHARLKVFGAIALPDRLMKPLPQGVELGGSIPRSELMEQYRLADALIFPTLCDGFGMVVTEAWSRGLPVITTESAGACDLLKPQVNGLLIPAGNAPAIGQILDWAVTHRSALDAMREGALATAANWQWLDYRRRLVELIRSAGILPGQ